MRGHVSRDGAQGWNIDQLAATRPRARQYNRLRVDGTSGQGRRAASAGSETSDRMNVTGSVALVRDRPFLENFTVDASI